MEMDDDDEFGDLYADVLRPLPSSSAPPPPPPPITAAPKPSADPLLDGGGEDADDQILFKPSLPTTPAGPPSQALAPVLADDADDDWMLGRAPAAMEQPVNWDDDDHEPSDKVQAPGVSGLPQKDEPRVLAAVEQGARVGVGGVGDREFVASEVAGDDLLGGGGEKMEIGEDERPVIPGLSATTYSPGKGVNEGDNKAAGSEGYLDSDSEDDLQIVLNDVNHGPLVAGRNKGLASAEDDDEDGEEDFVIVTDGDQHHHHHHQAMEEQDWGDEAMQMTVDGERKEMPEAGKGSGTGAGAVGPRIGYSNHGFHSQHHSMYKYIRPGAAPPVGPPLVASAAVPGQSRPPLSMGISGRGRGDWRPAFGRGVSTSQKSFPGYGLPAWNHSSSNRAFGGGLDFTLPSHKTVFDVDIDSFEEKPWRHQGVDISDFFNFGLDEDNWKAYCKQLDQFRLESTMQSKIRVYESGRSEQDYDPDLPPELAAVTGLHDTSENLHRGKVDGGQADLSCQGRAATCIRPPIPTGRAIQVEGGYGERLPSIDTRPPRIRDSDAIIEIVCQNSVDDSAIPCGVIEQPENDLHEDHHKGVHEAEIDNRHGELEYPDRFSHSFSDRKRGMVPGRVPLSSEQDGILPCPPEVPPEGQSHSHSKSRGPTYSSDCGARFPQGNTRGRYSSTSADHSIDVIANQNSRGNRNDIHLEEKSGDSAEGHHASGVSPADAVETARELCIEQGANDHDERLAIGDSIEAEGEDIVSDSRNSQETTNSDDNLVHSTKKQKLSSQVEQPVCQDYRDGDDLKVPYTDNNRVKSGSGKDYKKRHEIGEEEVIQDSRSRRMVDFRRHHEEDERKYRRKEDYGRDIRQDIETNRIASKGRADMYRSYPQRDLDMNSTHPVRGRNEVLERQKERDGPIGVWQRREDDIHPRRVKDEDIRRERAEELGSRHRPKVRVSDRKDSIEEINSRKRVDDIDWRSRDREGTSRQRERDDLLIGRREDLSDSQVRRSRDEEHIRRQKVDKEDPFHGYRAREDPSRTREDSSRRKRDREKDDVADRRRRDDVVRARERPEDYHSSRTKDDGWHQKEREDRQRLKQQPHEDAQRHRDREGRGVVRNGRVMEDKPLGGNGKNKDESIGLGSDKDNQRKDKRRPNPNENLRRGERTSEEKISQSRGHEDARSHEYKVNDDERSSRHEKSGSINDRPLNTSNGQQMFRERQRESTRKTSNNEAPERSFQGLGKRKHEEHTTEHIVQVCMKGKSEQESNTVSASLSSKDQPHIDDRDVLTHVHRSSMNQEEGLASDDENQDLRRGRSKVERWTSHIERDYSAFDDKQAVTSSMSKENEGFSAEIAQPEDLAKPGGDASGESGLKDADIGQASDRTAEDLDKHLDTVAKLRRRSERFKLPMPGEKDNAGSKKVENELQMAQNERTADAEVKPERPARKRRWTSG